MSTWDEAIDLDRVIELLLEKLELDDPNFVKSITLDAETVTVVTFARNITGNKFIGSDGNVALNTQMHPIKRFGA